MTDHRPEDEDDRQPAPEPNAEPVPGPPVDSPAVERRAFLRQLTGEAVVTSGRLAGLSSAVRRSLFAAVESATSDSGPIGGSTPEIASDTTTAEAPAAALTASAAPVAPAPVVPAPVVPAPVAQPMSVPLSPRQEDLLARAAIAVLGTNDSAGAPHLTASQFHWSASIVRLPSDLFAARVERIEADPRVSLLVAADGPDTWVAINGTATVVSGDAVEGGMMTIMRKYMSDEEADRSWAELRATGNPVVIEVRPSRYLWRFR